MSSHWVPLPEAGAPEIIIRNAPSFPCSTFAEHCNSHIAYPKWWEAIFLLILGKMCAMQKAHPNRRISYFKLHTCGMRNLRPHPESTESFSNTWDLKPAKERRKLDVWDEEGVKDEAREREENFATGARWRGRGEGEDGDWATERAPRVVIVIPGDTECGWGNGATTTAKSPNAVMLGYPLSKQSDNSANPPSPSFAKATDHRPNVSLRRCKPSPVLVPLSLPNFLTLQIAVSTETLQGVCVVGVVNKRTETHEWMQTHLSDLPSEGGVCTPWWTRIPFLTCPSLLRDGEANERGTSLPLLFIAVYRDTTATKLR